MGTCVGGTVFTILAFVGYLFFSFQAQAQAPAAYDHGIHRYWSDTSAAQNLGPGTDPSGNLNHGVQIVLPEARLTPPLGLRYGSGTMGDRHFGVGFSLDIPSISYDRTLGVPRYDGSDIYVGPEGPLVSVAGPSLPTGVGVPYEIEHDTGNSARVYFYDSSSDTWTSYGRDGIRMTFSSVLDGSDGTAWFTYEWMLTEIRDTNGNYATYSYTTDGEFSSLVYGGNDDTGDIAEYSVTPSWEFRNCETVTLASGASNWHTVRLGFLEVSERGTPLHRWEFDYFSDCPDRLSAIIEHGFGTTSGSPMQSRTLETYTWWEPSSSTGVVHTSGLPDLGSAITFSESIATDGASNTSLRFSRDIWLPASGNGDPLSDLVSTSGVFRGQEITHPIITGTEHDFSTGKKTASATAHLINHRVLQGTPSSYRERHITRLVDLDGDGYDDLIESTDHDSNPATPNTWEVFWGEGAGFGLTSDTLPNPLVNHDYPGETAFFIPGSAVSPHAWQVVQFVDVNGDGALDILEADLDDDGDGAVDTFIRAHLYDRQSNTWDTTEPIYAPWCDSGITNPFGLQDIYGIPDRCYVALSQREDSETPGSNYELVSFKDMNGDGNADAVVVSGGSWQSPPAAATPWLVYLGNGRGWELSPTPWFGIPGGLSSAVQVHQGCSGGSNDCWWSTRGTFDLNGDGLPDVMDMAEGMRDGELNGGASSSGVWYRNTGDGFVMEALPSNAPGRWNQGEDNTTGETLAKMDAALGPYAPPTDADYPAWVWCDKESSPCAWSDPSGGGFGVLTPASGSFLDWSASFTYSQVGDWNGDGAADFLDVENTEYWQLGSVGAGGGQAIPGAYRLKSVSGPADQMSVHWRSASEAFPSGEWSSAAVYQGFAATEHAPIKMALLDRVSHVDLPTTDTWSVDYEHVNATMNRDSYRFTSLGGHRVEDSEGQYQIIERSTDPHTAGLILNATIGEVGLGDVQTIEKQYKVWDRTPPSSGPWDNTAAVMELESKQTCGTTSSTLSTCIDLELQLVHDLDGRRVRADILNDPVDPDDDVVVTTTWAPRGAQGITKPCWTRVTDKDPAGATRVLNDVTSVYDSGSLCSIANGHLTEERHVESGAGRPSKTLTYTRTYHPDGRLHTYTSPKGHTTTLGYDADGIRVEQIDNALLHTTLTTTSPYGRETTQELPSGAYAETDYDAFGRPVQIRRGSVSGGLAVVEDLTYTDGTNPSVDQMGLAGRRIDYLNSLGESIQSRTELGMATWSVLDARFDAYGRPIVKGEARNGLSGAREFRNWSTHCSGTPSLCTQFDYDALGRESSIEDPFGFVTADVDGRPDHTVLRDPNGFQEHTEFDSRGMVSSRHASRGTSSLAAATYVYDGLGRMTESTDPDGVTTSIQWSSTGKLLRVASPDMGWREYWYDDDGNLIELRDSAGRVRSYVVDALGRTTEVWAGAVGSGTKVEDYVWDTTVDGLLHSVVDEGGTKVFGYDAAGRADSETRTFLDGSSATTTRTFDGLDRLVSEVLPDGTEVTYLYAFGRLDELKVKVPATGVVHTVAKLSYGTDGEIEGWVGDFITGSGTRFLDVLVQREIDGTISGLAWDYNGTGREVSLSRMNNGMVRSRTFSSTGPGSASVFGASDTTTFTYDPAGRVVTASFPGALPHGQDGVWSLSDGGDVTTAAYNFRNLGLSYIPGTHRLHQEHDLAGGGLRTWNYDASGAVSSVTELVSGVVTTSTISRDTLGRPSSFTEGGTVEWERWYGSDGAVVQENVDGTEIIRMGSWERVGGPFGTRRVTVSLLGIPVVRVVDGVDIEIVMTDLKGTPLTVTDDQGAPIYERQPTLLGETVASSGTLDQTDAFLGLPRHDSVGISGTGARFMYSPVGQFMSVDRALWDDRVAKALLQPYLMHPYRYSGGHLVQMGDPSGEFPFEIGYWREQRKEWIRKNVGEWYLYYPGEWAADGLVGTFELAEDHGENLAHCVSGLGCGAALQTGPPLGAMIIGIGTGGWATEKTINGVLRLAGPRAVVPTGKWAYMFGRATGAKNAAHNLPRTIQNLQQMRRIGVPDNAAGRAMLQRHFDRVVRDKSNIVRTWTNKYGSFEKRESLFAGPGGFARFETTWQVMKDGTRRFVTAIPSGGGI